MKLRNSGKSTRNVHVKDAHGAWTVQPVRPRKDSKDLTDEEFEHPKNQQFLTKGLMRAMGPPKLKTTPPPVSAPKAGGGEE